MPIDVRSLAIEHVIVHQVPKRDRSVDADSAIMFSDAPIPNLDPTRLNFFGERINKSLLERPFAIVPLEGAPSRVPELVSALIDESDNLVPASQEMARVLYNAQTRVNNPGLLTVVLGRLGGALCVAVLKLQHHEAMRMQPITTPEGQRTFSADILGDLTLTDDTKVFKASVFRKTGAGEADLEGLASDDQRGTGLGADLADFWLSKFLGCGFAEAPDRVTLEFYDATSTFIDTLPDPEQRIEYRRALVATLLSPATSMSAPQFSEQFLRDNHKASYDAVLAERGVTTTTFDKDLRRIQNHLRRTRVTTEHRLTIVGPPDEIEQRVHIEAGDGDTPPRIVIDDAVVKVGE